MQQTKTLYEMAKVLRSKNSGPFELTMDAIFETEDDYVRVKDSGLINKELVCQLYHIQPEDILHIVFFDAARALKITIKRPVVSGGVAETDVYGAQQHAPLMNVRIPV